jgi:acyl-coenzyme A thioesterase PaaI-like protein
MTQLGDAVQGRGPSGGPGPWVLSDAAGFINDLVFEFDVTAGGTHGEGRASITPMMRSTGSLARPAVLLTIADCIAGVPAMHVSSPRLAVTLDMTVRIVAGTVGAELEMTSDVLKQGRNTVASEVRFTDAGSGELAALCYLTFMTSPRPQDASPPVPDAMQFNGSLPVSFPERVGLRTVSPGITELDRRPFVVQASGSLQGGMVALLAETAAESLTGRPVLELDARFFTGVRVGPGRATAAVVGDGLVRVEVRDAGNADRLAALVTARVARQPSGDGDGDGDGQRSDASPASPSR